MATFWRRLREGNSLIYIVLALSAIYLTFIAMSVHEGIFYAGDQGIKSLVVKQMAQGYGFKYLHLPQPAWVQSIWKAGFTPLREPSFYPSPAGYIVVFPPAFQIVSSWLYERWGAPGLYVIPMLSTAVLLGWFVVLLKRCGVKPMYNALAVFILVFCSPLALYGVMFWEHLPAVLLLFAGVAFITDPPAKKWIAALLGMVTGLAVFLRPEALAMNLLYAAAATGLYYWNIRRALNAANARTNPVAFLTGMAIPIVAFFIFNQVEYGSILGMHARQVFVDDNPETRMGFRHGLDNLWQNNSISTRHFLLVLLVVPVLVRAIAFRKAADPRPGVLAAIVVLFSVLTPWLLPNNGVVQWGARYFLALIPVTLVALFLAEHQWNLLAAKRIPQWALCTIVIGIGYCFYHNTHGGGYKEVRWRYNQRLTKEYKLIDSQPGNVVILSHHWMINDFAYLFDKDYFFTASGNDSLRQLLPLLKKNGIRRYIYIFNPQVPTLPTMLEDSATSHWWTDRAHNKYVKDDYAAKVVTLY